MERKQTLQQGGDHGRRRPLLAQPTCSIRHITCTCTSTSTTAAVLLCQETRTAQHFVVSQPWGKRSIDVSRDTRSPINSLGRAQPVQEKLPAAANIATAVYSTISNRAGGLNTSKECYRYIHTTLLQSFVQQYEKKCTNLSRCTAATLYHRIKIIHCSQGRKGVGSTRSEKLTKSRLHLDCC